ncbi:uncharacterized protein LOC108024010 [Drosophila biarmipes]|uniref:uncharacterized protein LOC108024010 n=1 Tax=Drosophila biarmipes TaxID=125945 RepID=UPI001CDA5EB6|nr:uncharacterized protein LOC108024010 [Drosophila biarmipes]XP_043948767.1 uncharacterized protein LOC108024010 [Drosophila biarmipes]XP_043948768.1 uncharacterized protein LOC108024010 [Drosophila biarmipes]XP_043948769.1 uncharacterized protein LOC108024010 [Drosophila biarmipes]XP_043948770.1 uncharacterized protein LOC108024010 [Drosophila biarmipes]XP_043948771.1 uncharacterized protein LOC108024010 [Drosophila biarmipes]XP_043948773.1 uncharacterized protein LOC108024010 [Drosophila b
METKNPPPVTSSYHHQRAPRTPESYFNVPESVALLNIVKSERIQSAFQSNRKNHASVWEMVAEVLNRFSTRKRTAKQCCNRYENLKKIYTQLKKNPERHVRRNWPYMFLFKEIEEQRGECWGSNGKRLALITKNHNELSYYQRRRQAAELGVLLTKDNLTPQQHSLLQSLSQSGQSHSHAHSTDSSQSGSKLERFLPNHFVEAQLNDGACPVGGSASGLPGGGGVPDENPFQMHVAAATAAAAAAAVAAQKRHELQMASLGGGVPMAAEDDDEDEAQRPAFKNHLHGMGHGHALGLGHGPMDDGGEGPDFEKDCNGALNMHHQNNNHHDNNISMKSEPLSEGEFNPDDIQLMQTNYNGAQNYYSPGMDPNILHPDVIVDTDNLSDCSSSTTLKKKRKMSTSTDGDSTNYELIEYLKRREKRDEEFLKRMDAREDRLMNLLERTVVAIETLAVRRSLQSLPVAAAVREEKQTPAAAAPCGPFSPPPEAQFAAPPAAPTEQPHNGIVVTPGSSSSSLPSGGDQISTTIEVPDDGDSSGEEAPVTDKAAPVPKAGEEERAEVKQA